MEASNISNTLQHEILTVLSVYHPLPPTVRQYQNCFHHHTEYKMSVNIYFLVMKELIDPHAITVYETHLEVNIKALLLTAKGFDQIMATASEEQHC